MNRLIIEEVLLEEGTMVYRVRDTNTPQEFMAAYDINDSDGSATLNWMKAALLPSWRETFKKLEASSKVENKKRAQNKLVRRNGQKQTVAEHTHNLLKQEYDEERQNAS